MIKPEDSPEVILGYSKFNAEIDVLEKLVGGYHKSIQNPQREAARSFFYTNGLVL